MERAVKLFGKLKLPAAVLTPDQMMRAAWPAAVGKTIAAHSRAAAVKGSRLIVEVEDAIWQRQLYTLRNQILARLNAVLGDAVVGEVDFRVAVPRRPPRIEERTAASGGDEAERISDPVLRRLYRNSRKKALA